MSTHRPRILHLVTSDARRGAETAAFQLVDALAEAGIDGELHALAPAHGATTDRLPIPTLGRSTRSPRTIARTRQLARRHDLVIAHGSDTLLVTALATIGLPVPFVYLMIGDPDVWGDVPLARLRIGAPLQRAAAIAVLWPGAGRAIQHRHHLPADRIHIIPNGRDPDHFRPPTGSERDDARRTLGLESPSSGPVIAWIGALTEEKRPVLAVQVASRIPNATLVMAGDGPLRTDVQAAAAHHDVDLRLLGIVDDVRSVLRAADALLLTSRTEGMPGVAVEAAHSDLPIAAPALGGLPDLLGPDHPGLFDTNTASTSQIVEHAAMALQATLDAKPTVPTNDLSTTAVTNQWRTLIGSLATTTA